MRMKNGLARLVCVSLILHFSFFTFHSASAQIAGMNTLTLLDLGSGARASGLGFDYLVLPDGDISVAIDNASMLGLWDDSQNQYFMAGRQASLSYVSLFSGSSMGALAYTTDFGGRISPMLFAFRFNNYGSFEGYDEEEISTGDFHAADYALSAGWSIPVARGLSDNDQLHFGVMATSVLSQYDQYRAFALSFDLMLSYFRPSKGFAATLAARNIGAQLFTFDGTGESLPFELSAEVSYKLTKAPFRFFFAANELQRWNLRYEDPLSPTTETDPFTGEVTKEGWLEGFVDNLLRHAQVGVEINIGKAIFARVGYSYRQSAEMRGLEGLNMSGFSFGIGIHTKRFDFAYARRNYHLSQAPDFFTLSYRF